jgi:hypothetical protein
VRCRVPDEKSSEGAVVAYEVVQCCLYGFGVADRVLGGAFTAEYRVDHPSGLPVTGFRVQDDPVRFWYCGVHEPEVCICVVYVDYEEVDVVLRVDLDEGELAHVLAGIGECRVLVRTAAEAVEPVVPGDGFGHWVRLCTRGCDTVSRVACVMYSRFRARVYY